MATYGPTFTSDRDTYSGLSARFRRPRTVGDQADTEGGERDEFHDENTAVNNTIAEGLTDGQRLTRMEAEVNQTKRAVNNLQRGRTSGTESPVLGANKLYSPKYGKEVRESAKKFSKLGLTGEVADQGKALLHAAKKLEINCKDITSLLRDYDDGELCMKYAETAYRNSRNQLTKRVKAAMHQQLGRSKLHKASPFNRDGSLNTDKAKEL
ncbi:hypothetical protein ABPG77_003373 [Micractinium sp. CCAP 211/92]